MTARAGTVLVVGATSSLAEALCRRLAKKGHSLILAGRDREELALLAADLAARFSTRCITLFADLAAPDFSPDLFIAGAGGFDSVIIAAGDMGNGDPNDFADFAHVARINYILPSQIAVAAAAYFSLSPSMGDGQGGGEPAKNTPPLNLPPQRGGEYHCIAIISSVAGDRGRRGYIAYGSAKAALTASASSLRARYAGTGVHVMTVKPGFVDTPMTWGMKGIFSGLLIASRECVAEKIIAAMEKKKNVIYVPWFWRVIMLIIRHIPEAIFKRLKL
ncbi:MAG: SDR family NAD(P)-dependent oxidoreductase [Pseudomonadota bacterium]|nr:SDR family NAD(P)-dependent oxidoreductase [Pseudomonadota bacterium]MDE3037612.1 SDR family NAD(P)-dependent oxidoreductase [Pseudomonadota bacterium]